jgi:aldose 1-epimerase
MPSLPLPIIHQLDARHPEPVVRVELSSASGVNCVVSNLGAALHRLFAPDRSGDLTNIVLGYETLQEYEEDPFFIGATVGRVANRIAEGHFELDGRDYVLERNNPPHHLHGGSKGWHTLVWRVELLNPQEGCGVRFHLDSPDGDSGYPGRVRAQVSYLLIDNDLHIVMEATSDAPTPLNLAHHSYFNLTGKGNILGHQLRINAEQYTPGTPIVPNGERRTVAQSCFDRVGLELPQGLNQPNGFDLNYLLPNAQVSPTIKVTPTQPLGARCGTLQCAAELFDPESGRHFELWTNQPGLQFYTGNYLDGRAGLPMPFAQHSGLCLETQAVPNFINLNGFREQGLLRPGWTYRHEMRLRFSTQG